jgi:hypothetical protein
MGYTKVSGLTPFCGGQTTKVVEVGGLTTLCGGLTMRGCFGSPKILSFRKFLRVFPVIQILITIRDFQN